MTEVSTGRSVSVSLAERIACRLYGSWILSRKNFGWSLFRALRGLNVLPIVLGLASAVVAPAIGLIMNSLLGEISGSGKAVWLTILGLCALVAAQRTIAWAETIILRRRAEMVTSVVQRCLVRFVLGGIQPKQGLSLNLLVTRYPQILSQYVFLPSLIGNWVAVGLLVAAMVFVAGWVVTIAVLLAMGILLGIGSLLNKREALASFDVERAEAGRTRLFSLVWGSSATLARQSLGAQIQTNFTAARSPQISALRKRVRANAVARSLTESFTILVFIGGLVGVWAIGADLTGASGVAVLVIVRLLSAQLTSAIDTQSCLQDARPVFSALEKDLFEQNVPKRPSVSPGKIIVRNKIAVPIGSRVAVIGATGSGKSQLLREIAEGLTNSEPESLPSENVLFLQRVEPLLPGNVRGVITLWSEDVDEVRYQEAVHGAGLSSDLLRWGSEGESRVVGEEDGLSDGERARISLAQALYWTPNTLILDDLFAAFDSDTAHRVASTVLTDKKVSTVVFSTSRIELLCYADVVLLVENNNVYRIRADLASETLLRAHLGKTSEQEIMRILKGEVRPLSGKFFELNPDDTYDKKIISSHRPGDEEIVLPALRDLVRNTVGLFGAVGTIAVLGIAVIMTAVTALTVQLTDATEGVPPLFPLVELALTSVVFTFCLQQFSGVKAISRMTRLQQYILHQILRIDGRRVPLSRVTADIHLAEFRGPERLVAAYYGLFASFIVVILALVSQPLLFWVLTPALVLLSLVYHKGRYWRRRAVSLSIQAREPVLTFAEAATGSTVKSGHVNFRNAVIRRFTKLADREFFAAMQGLWISAVILGIIELLAIFLFAGTATVLAMYPSHAGLATGALIYLAYVLTSELASIIEQLQKTDGLQSLFSRVGSLTGNSVLTIPQTIFPREGLTTTVSADFPYHDGELDLTSISSELTLAPGKVVGLTGPSGVGKSTLLRSLLINENSDSGGAKVLLLDSDLPLLDQTISDFLNPNHLIDSRELAEVWRRIHYTVGVPPPDMETKINSLSHGEHQLANLVRAIVTEPQILLLDEALSALDSRAEAKILETLPHYLPCTAILVVLHRMNNLELLDSVVALDWHERMLHRAI